MHYGRKTVALLLTALTCSSLLAGFGSANSHYPLSVVLWNDSAQGKTVGQNFTAWAQVDLGDAPTNATAVTFRFGLGVLAGGLPAVNFTGTYAGSPGLYRATILLAVLDVAAGGSGLSVLVNLTNNSANSFRWVVTAANQPPPPPPGPWTVTAGIENYAALGPTLDPGETVIWRVDTYDSGVHADTSNLTLALFESPDVNFSETPSALTPVRQAAGVYTATLTLPAALTESRQYTLRATVNESNVAQVDASADVWFYDTVAAFSQHNATALAGELTVGDGTNAVNGLAAALEVTESGNPSHSLGWVNGTTAGGGKLAFAVPNDGTLSLAVRGWINGSYAQFVAATITLPGDFTPPAFDPTRFDAVPLENLSLVPWSGFQNLTFKFYANGTVWANKTVLAFVSSSRGIIGSANLTTDGNGTARFAVDFDRQSAVADDGLNGGVNFTFRAATGADNRSSDGRYWGEDLEVAMPDPTGSGARALFDTNISFATETFALGATIGVGAKYTGAKNVSTFEGAAVLFPGSVMQLFGPYTETYAIWTGHDQPFFNLLVDGSGGEFYGAARAPSYWPNTTYTLVAAIVPSLSTLGDASGITLGALNWTELSPAAAKRDFTPSADTLPPEILGLADITVNSGEPANFSAEVYDNSLDFHARGNFTWNFTDRSGPVTLYGLAAAWVFNIPGDYTVQFSATDGSGNTARRAFVVHVLDHTPPSVTLPADFSTVAGALTWFNATVGDDDPGFPGNGSLGWSFLYNGSLVNQTGAVGSFTFWALGTFDLNFTARDAAGNNASKVLRLTVTSPDLIAPTVSAGPDRSVLAGTPVDFNGTASDNEADFAAVARCGWSFTYNGSLQTINGSNFTFTFWTLGAVDLLYSCLDGWNNLGQDTMTLTVQSPDTVAPVAAAGADTTVVAGATVAFNGSATDNDPAFPAGASYWWTFTYNGTAQNVSGANFSFRFDATGQYLVTLSVRDGWGNVGTDDRRVTVVPPDTTAPIIAAIADQTVVQGGWLFLNASATDDDPAFGTTGTISWSFTANGTARSISGPSFQYLFDAVGDVSVSVTARDQAGNAGSRTFVVHVVPPDTTPPLVSVSASSTTVTVGSTVTFTGTAMDAGAPITDGSHFAWSLEYNGSTVSRTGSSFAFAFDRPGTYVVTLTVSDPSGNRGAANATLTVTAAPGGTATAAGSDLLLYVLAALLAAAAIGGFLVVRRRDSEPAPRAPEAGDRTRGGQTGASDSPAQSGKKGDAESGDEDKDLDNMLN